MSVAQAHNCSRSQYCKGIFWPQAPVIMLRVVSLLMAVCIGWSSHHALAQQKEQRVALVIGNSAYKDAPLKNAANDASDMAQALRELGFKVNLKTNAGQRQMKDAIRDFGQQLTKGGVGLFYYAGHGVQYKGRNFLVPIGASIEREAHVEDETVDAAFVLAQMEEARNRVNLVILDACRNNPFSRGFRSVARGLAQMDAAQGTLVAFATAPGSVAADGDGRNGVYTKHLLRQMRQPGVPVELMFKRVRDGVISETKEKQTPWESSSLRGADFYFRAGAAAGTTSLGGAAPTADAATIELGFWDSIKESTDRADFEEYLREYPQGRFAGLAKNRIQSATTQLASVAPSSPAGAAGSVAAMSPGSSFRDCDICPEMVVIPAGTFTMGSPPNEPERDADEGPQHQVRISRAFAVGKYEVTFGEWDACVRENGCNHNPDDRGWGRGRRPVINVSWNDAKRYLEWLSGKADKNYRLLSEAQWEYVARAGTTTAFSFGERIAPHQANYDTSVSYAGSPAAASAHQTMAVGSYPANAFGLHDIHGNVWEWTEDCGNSNYYGAPTDGSAWTSGNCGQRVLRGGSLSNNPRALRSAFRLKDHQSLQGVNFGLRVARTD